MLHQTGGMLWDGLDRVKFGPSNGHLHSDIYEFQNIYIFIYVWWP
jgi:hypothetical protein